jgi:type IV secretory pathway VirB4 component
MNRRKRRPRPVSRPAPTPGQDDSAVPGPESIQVTARHLRVGPWWAATLAVTGYPAEVGPGWLEPLTTYPGRLDVSVHIEPIPPAVAADRLRKQRARLESGRRADYSKGRLDDPEAEAAADDARELAYQIARGEGRLFRVGLYLTVYAATQENLAAEVATVRTLAESLLLQTQPATFRTLQGWLTSLPLATDLLKLRRAFDTAALSASFPFASPDLAAGDPASAAATGVLYGLNAASSGIVCWDRWAQDNHNSVILGRSGGGKSYLTKLDILRSLYQQVEVAVIDPEDEYARLSAAVGGAYVHLGADQVRLNPFDLPPAHGRARPDALMRRALFLHTFLAVLLGEQPSAAQRAALDLAIMTAYQQAGITADPRTWARPAPLLANLAAVLASSGDAGRELAAQLVPFTEGTHSQMFAGPTTTRPDGHLIVWSLRDLPDELKAAGTLLTLDAIWRRVCDPASRRRRLVVVDEAWLLMRDGQGAQFLFRMAKAARKYWAGLVVVTQDAEDVLGTELGRAVVNNAATQILLRQSPQAVDLVSEAFRLSAGEREFLLSAERGEGLLAAGATDRVAFKTVASDFEHGLATTSPEFLASLPGTTPTEPGIPFQPMQDVGAYFDDDQPADPSHPDPSDLRKAGSS